MRPWLLCPYNLPTSSLLHLQAGPPFTSQLCPVSPMLTATLTRTSREILYNFPKQKFFFFSSVPQYIPATQTHEWLHYSDLCSRPGALWTCDMHLYFAYWLHIVRHFKEEGDSCLPSAFCEFVTCIFLFLPNKYIICFLSSSNIHLTECSQGIDI